jgi:hypothetical protein
VELPHFFHSASKKEEVKEPVREPVKILRPPAPKEDPFGGLKPRDETEYEKKHKGSGEVASEPLRIEKRQPEELKATVPPEKPKEEPAAAAVQYKEEPAEHVEQDPYVEGEEEESYEDYPRGRYRGRGRRRRPGRYFRPYRGVGGRGYYSRGGYQVVTFCFRRHNV